MSRSYNVVWNRSVACWRWLFQTWRFLRFSLVRNMAVIYSPDDTDIYGSGGGKFVRIWSVQRVESCKILFLWALPIHLFRHFCCRMYRLVTMHSVTDRRTDSRRYDANRISYCVLQYDRLKLYLYYFAEKNQLLRACKTSCPDTVHTLLWNSYRLDTDGDLLW